MTTSDLKREVTVRNSSTHPRRARAPVPKMGRMSSEPAAVFTHKFNYPCPLPTPGPATSACMLSTDRPPRARPVKY